MIDPYECTDVGRLYYDLRLGTDLTNNEAFMIIGMLIDQEYESQAKLAKLAKEDSFVSWMKRLVWE